MDMQLWTATGIKDIQAASLLVRLMCSHSTDSLHGHEFLGCIILFLFGSAGSLLQTQKILLSHVGKDTNIFSVLHKGLSYKCS